MTSTTLPRTQAAPQRPCPRDSRRLTDPRSGHRSLRRPPRTARRGGAAGLRARPLAIAACAALLGLAAVSPAQAQERWWRFVGGCGSADWFGTNGVFNAEGGITCWSRTNNGLSGSSAPGPLDDAFIMLPTATAETLVTLARPDRSELTATARHLVLSGSSSFAAGLAVDRLGLVVQALDVGTLGVQRGLLRQGGGGVSVLGTARVTAGAIELDGGSFSAGVLDVRAAATTAGVTQTGGSLVAGSLRVSSAQPGTNGQFTQLGGTANVNTLLVGALDVPGTGRARFSGTATAMDVDEATTVGVLSAGELAVDGGARLRSGTLSLGVSDGVSGLARVTGTGSRLLVDGAAALGVAGGSGRLQVDDGGSFEAGALSVERAPGASGVALEAFGNRSSVVVNGPMTLGLLSEGRAHVHGGATVLSGETLLGLAGSALGEARLSGAARWQSGALQVGAGGSGRLLLSEGSVFEAAGASFASQAGSQALMELDDTGTRWSSTGSVLIGGQGQASVTVRNRAQLATQGTTLAAAPGASARVAVAGEGSRWRSASMNVGSGGDATVLVTDGARIESLGTLGAATNSGNATMTVEGGGQWLHDGEVQLAVTGDAQLDVLGAGRFTARSLIAGSVYGAKANLRVNGPGSQLAVAEGMSLGQAGTAEMTIEAGGRVQVRDLTLGEVPSGRGAMYVMGETSRLDAAEFVRVGWGGHAWLDILDGAQVHTDQLSVGSALLGGRGVVSLQGDNALLTTRGNLEVNRGRIRIDAGAQVTTNGLTSAGPAGQVQLNGGRLVSGSVALGAPERLDFHSGTLHITGTETTALDGVALPTQMALLPGQRLQLDHALGIGPGSVMLLSGGELLAGELHLDHGVLASTEGGAHALNLDQTRLLTGRGQVAARVSGGTADTRIVADGPLALGLAHRSDGFDFNGTLEVGAHTVVLNDADLAGLGRLTTLADGGRLVAAEGMAVGPDEALHSRGQARIDGALVNDGEVRALDGALSFSGLVSGQGRFGGEMRFFGGLAPGGGDTALLDFDGGDVTIASFSTLTLDIWSPLTLVAPGSADGPAGGVLHDQLTGIDTLRFDGELVLNFAPGFTAEAGTSLQLFGFSQFTGSFAGDRITVNGLDAAWLDFTHLAVDGRLLLVNGTGGLPPIPEPSTWALMLAGLASVGWLGRRRPLPVAA